MKEISDLELCKATTKKMVDLYNFCESRGIEINLSHQSFINLMYSKKCQFSGATFGGMDDIKICMLNPNLGYVRGNVMATDQASYSFITNRIHAVMVSNCTQAKKSMKRIIGSF